MEPVVHRYVDYYFTPQSPWTYLGHARLVALAEAHRFIVRPKVADFGRVFSVSGGLPVGQRPLQRQSYRLLELERFASHMGVPMHVSPRYFPVDPTRASRRLGKPCPTTSRARLSSWTMRPVTGQSPA